MPKNLKTVLFLCTGNYYRSRFAEILFNSVAKKMSLAWRAASKGLALERGVNNFGPISAATVSTLKNLGVVDVEATSRFPMAVTAEDFDDAHLVIALKKTEHLPLFEERFPAVIEKVEFWHVDDAPGALDLVEREVMGLAARLIGGGARQEPTSDEPVPDKPVAQAKSAATVKVGRETKGRRGKGVTIVSDVPVDENGLAELAATLKQKCGTGGTIKDGRIEIQGDQRDRLVAVLEGLGYRVKRAGG